MPAGWGIAHQLLPLEEDRRGVWLEALRPRRRRRSRQPNETPPWQIDIILAEAISRPTLGAGQLLEFLEDRGVIISEGGVQKVLRNSPAE